MLVTHQGLTLLNFMTLIYFKIWRCNMILVELLKNPIQGSRKAFRLESIQS